MEINNKIYESPCSFELSKLLKEKGFRVPSDFYFFPNGANGITGPGNKTWEDLRDGKGDNIIRPDHNIAMKWVRINFNWHFELIWDIEEGEKIWFYAISPIGECDKEKHFDTPKRKTIEEATEDALFKALGKEPIDPNSIQGIDYERTKEIVLEEYAEGNIVVAAPEGLRVISLKEFVQQPVEGILYDLNRDEATVLTLIKNDKWFNDYAVCKVIQELKREIDELKSKQK